MVWKYFKVDEKDENYAICTIRGYGKGISQGLPHSTTPLLRHLQVVSTELPKKDHLLKEVSPNRPSSSCQRLSAGTADHTMRCVMLQSYGQQLHAALSSLQMMLVFVFSVQNLTQHFQFPSGKLLQLVLQSCISVQSEYLLCSYPLGRHGILCLC